ncbi:MAG TPA: phytanoyl-CoA dioxygenase family protein [Pyrinomonadaceae bacterium]|nr:phytanoyl-CoA dioxygenase family protein [Pyrinomonadaceae bacterium]
MRLTQEQLQTFREQGFLCLDDHFSLTEIETLRAQLPSIFKREGLGRIVEAEGGVVRSVYGPHLKNEIFQRLSRHPRILEPSIQILESPVYLYQVKINAKVAFVGDLWEWHQDYVYWLNEDGMPSPRVINAAVFLDDMTEFNGPMFFIPGSHREGVFDLPNRDDFLSDPAARPEPYRHSPAWISTVTAQLRYSFDREAIAELVSRYGIVSPKCRAGSVIFFHPNIVHASPNNISPFDRISVVVTYNSIENIPQPKKEPRPEFLVGRNHAPLTALPDSALLTLEAEDQEGSEP